MQKVIQRAISASKANGDSLVALDHLLIAIYDDKTVKETLEGAGLTKKLAITATEEIRGGRKVTSTSAEETYEALERYGQDLVKAAEEGKLDPVIGRDDEIRRIIKSMRVQKIEVLRVVLVVRGVKLVMTVCPLSRTLLGSRSAR